MDITPYLEELIRNREQVVVPGLGKFFKKVSAGYFDAQQKVYHPPSKKIEFTAEYLHDDKLVQLIHQKNNISLTSAYASVDEYNQNLKTKLKQGEQVLLAGIGKLLMKDGEITLHPDEAQELNKAYFGLPTIAAQSNVAKASPTVAETEQYSLAQQAIDTAMPDDYEEDRPKGNAIKITLLLLVIVLLGSLIAIYYVNPVLYQKLINSWKKVAQTEQPAPRQNADAKALQKADSIYKSKSIEEKLKAEGLEVEKARDSTDVTIDKNTIPNNSGIRYEIIISQYTKKEDAEARVKKLIANGINAYILKDADGPLIKISCASFYNKANAEKELKRVQEELNPQAFIKPIKTLK